MKDLSSDMLHALKDLDNPLCMKSDYWLDCTMKELHARGLIFQRDNGITWSWEILPEGRAVLLAREKPFRPDYETLVAENAAMRERIEKFEWYMQVNDYDLWREHPMCGACGNSSKRGQIFNAAAREFGGIRAAALKAIE